MKRDFLKNFKVGEQEFPKDVIDAILDENGRDIGAAKAEFSDYDTIKVQLAEAGKAIEGFKAMDIDGIKQAADDWKLKAEQAESAAAAQVEELQFNTLLDGAVGAARGKNAKAVKALLDIDALKASKNRSEDIKAALEAVQKENAYLFDAETPPPYATGTGTQITSTKYTPEMNAIRAAAGLKSE